MQKPRNYKRNKKAVSKILSVLLMITIALAAALLAYAWIMGYFSTTTTKTGKAIMIQSVVLVDSELRIYAQNVGQGSFELDSRLCTYINGLMKPSKIDGLEGKRTLIEGETATITEAGQANLAGTRVTIRIVTLDGTFALITVSLPEEENILITIMSNPAGSSYIRIDDSPVNTPAVFSWEIGSTHKLEALSPVAGATSTQYVWTNWTDGKEQTHDYTVPDSPETITANYMVQYQITVTSSPAETISGTFEVTYTQSGTTYTDTEKVTPWTEWADSDTSVTVSDPQVIINGVTGTQYNFSSYDPSNSITMDNAKAITLVYTTQHLVSFRQTGSGVNPNIEYQIDAGPIEYGAVPFDVWVNDSSQISYTYEAVVSGSGERYILFNVNPSSPQTVNDPITITGTYQTQYQITVTGNPTGGTFKVTYTQAGTTYTNVQKTTTWVDWADSGTIVTVTDPQNQIDGTLGIRYIFDHYDPSNSVSMSSSKTITLVYRTQYQVTFSVDPSGSGTTSPSTPTWYDTGATPSISTTDTNTDDGRVFCYWDADTQLISFADTWKSPTTATINGPGMITAYFRIPTRIDWYTSPPDLDLGESEDIIGILYDTRYWWLGGLNGKQITIVFTAPNNTQFPITETTNFYFILPGVFEHSFRPDVAGTWSIYAQFNGDPTYNASKVSPTAFNVAQTLLPHFVDGMADLHSPTDVGSHSSFANMQNDGGYDTLTEADTDSSTGIMGVSTTSGTSYTTISGDDMAGQAFTASGSGRIQSVTFYGRSDSSQGNSRNVKAIITDSSGNILTNGISNVISVSTTAGDWTATFASPPVVQNGQTYWIMIIPNNSLRLYYQATTGGTSKSDTSNSYTSTTNPTDASTGTINYRRLYASIYYDNYQLDLEVQFTGVTDFALYTQLCIETGNLASENIRVDYWNGVTWINLQTDLNSDTLNTITVSLTGPTFEIRFNGGTETNDTTQSSWPIDFCYLNAP